jgi:chromosome segregation protein
MFLLDNQAQKKNLEDSETNLKIASKNLDEAKAKYEDTKHQYEEIQTELETLDHDIEEARAKITDTSVMREKLEGQIGIMNEQIRSATSDAEHFAKRKADEETKIADKEKEKEKVLLGKNEIDKELEALSADRQEARKKLDGIIAQISDINNEIENCKSKIIQTLSDRSTIKSKLSSLDTRQEQINIRKAELTGKLVKARSDESQQEEIIKKLQAEFDQITEEIRTMNMKQKDSQNELDGIRDKLTQKDTKLRDVQNLYTQQKSKLEALSNLTERYEGYGGSVKKVMEKKDDNLGIIGVVADIIKTQPKYETAIEIALGGNIQNIVTDDEDTAKDMIEYLKKSRAGRATFLPLTSIREPQEFKAQEALNEKGVLGMADELVDTEDKYRSVAKAMLGRIVVVDTVDNAVLIARKYKYTIRMVTLEGELLVPGGAISGGTFRNNSNLLGRRREMEDLEKSIKKCKDDIALFQKEIDDTKKRRNELRTAIEELRTALQSKFIEQNTARINVENEKERQNQQKGDYSDLKAESENIEQLMVEIKTERDEYKNALELSEKTEKDESAKVTEYQARLEALHAEEEKESENVSSWDIEYEKILQKETFEQQNLDRINGEIDTEKAALDEILESIKKNDEILTQRKKDIEEIKLTIESSKDVQTDVSKELDEKRARKEKLTASQKNFFKLTEELNQTMNGLDKEVTRLGARCERAKEAIETQINYMWDEYEITLTDAASMRDENMTDVSAMKKQIGSLKDAIRKLGDVNVNAIEDYRILMERYTFLKTQHDDLVAAEQQLREIIAELDESMRKQFMEEFTKIQTEFDKVFKEMFGGGKGTLELVEDVDILEAGIRINAQPPGKKLVNMMQLSGGEKALAAIALLFAIQNLKPSPFCLLDEIEAALDENNVVRFAHYLHKLKSTQFVVITHRRGTMESADRLYGITMQEKGVSTLVSVNLIDKELTD